MRVSRALLASALSTATALAGCLDDGTELYDEEGELVGGTATASRPEIGRFWNGNGNENCTATLIGPRTVLTAAHCVEPDYTATMPLAGAVFVIDGQLPITVDRIHSFATKRFEAVPGTPWTTDTAVLHLASAVPVATALPAALAVQEPYNGDASTIFGYGCTDRTPPPGVTTGGFKQFFSFTYPNATNALCWGDSGGPVVYGAQTGSGAIWGVNSDFNVGWDIGWQFPDGWTDMFGAVPFYKKQVEDLTRAWDGPDELGFDRPGMDLTNGLVANLAACRALCESDGSCRAFTYAPEGSGGRCWRKGGAPEPVPSTFAGIASGLPRRLEVGVDRAGSDYAVVSAPSADACSGICGRDHNCQAFTYVGTSCWLKNSVPAAGSCPTCTSGVPRRGLEVGVNRGGMDIATHTAASARVCADLCAKNEACEAYTHTSAATNNCWLKNGVAGGGWASGMTSGVRRGVETNTYRGGTLLQSFWTQPSPYKCQTACANHASCASWSYQPPPSNGPDAACFLFTDVGGRWNLTGYVSGIKGLEFLP